MKKDFLIFIVILFIVWIGAIFMNKSSEDNKRLMNFISNIYYFKRISEKIQEKFQFSEESKLQFHRELLKTRLSELKHAAENRELGIFQSASQRFSFEAGKIIEYTTNIKQNEKLDIKNQFISYKPVLEKLRDLYPANSSYWMLIQYDIDTLELMLEKLK